MSKNENSPAGIQILSPVTGQAVPLDQVPDPVFSQKIIGDGMAVIPSDGRIVSPVDGEVVSVADTLHAYGFRSKDGLELLIHVGLETVALKGECFKAHAKVGDKVKAGDLVGEVDLQFLKERDINPITPVLVCGGLDGKTMEGIQGQVKAGEDAVLLIAEAAADGTGTAAGAGQEQKAAGKSATRGTDAGSAGTPGASGTAGSGGEAKPEKKKLSFNFDFLQKLGKVLMVVIAVMPAAGLMISLGKLVQMAGVDVHMIFMVGSTMENIGWAIINNLHILFAAAIGGSWAKERAGGAFAAIIAFILVNSITGAIFGVTAEMLADAEAVTHTLFGQEILVNGYFTSVLGAPALNMGVFVGIISGFMGGIIYNKYYNFRKLPDALSFFNGKRFVPMVVIAWSVIVSGVLAVVWPVVQTGVTEPLEFMFMFCALPLYLVYAVLQGCAFALAGIIHLRLHSFGNLEFATRIPMSVKAGLTGDVINFCICVAAFLAIGYVVAYVMIDKLKFATPGRLGNYTDESGDEGGAASVAPQGGASAGGGSQAERIIGLLGGRGNITLVDACMTRLRVTVKDPALVADLPAWKAEGALGLIKKDNGIQAVYGPKADVLKSDINDIL